MRIITAPEVQAALDTRTLVERLRAGFRADIASPLRHIHAIEPVDETDGTGGGTLMLMPAWARGSARMGDMRGRRGFIGVKVQTAFPANRAAGKPTLMGVYLLMSGTTGEPLAMIDAPAITAWRTAAASALAATYLARQDAQRLLMVGAGNLAPYLIRAHAAVRPICNVLVWNRTPGAAERLATRLSRPDFRVTATTDLEGAVRGADIVCCATMSDMPLIRGAWLAPGTHLDLVGGYTPEMREADNDVIRRARMFVDTREGALAEAGDIVQPIADNILTADDIAADLYELARGERAGRRFHDQITAFKSVGAALEDLVTATLVAERS